MKASQVLNKVVFPRETMLTFSVTPDSRAVETPHVMLGSDVPLHISFATEEFLWSPTLVSAVLMRTVAPDALGHAAGLSEWLSRHGSGHW